MASRLLSDLYEPHVRNARARIAGDVQLCRLLDPHVDPRLIELFFIHYCSLGVHLTEPVEGWIRRAGERCAALGYQDVGKSLITHAHHEAGHHTMMIDDTRRLVGQWNAHHAHRLDAVGLLSRPPTAAARAYVKLHEDTIASLAPFAQVGIEYEVEGLSEKVGKPLIDNTRRVLGDGIIASLSFLAEHVAIDVGHTQLNEKMLERLLTQHPRHAEAIGKAGAEALGIYLDFMGECVQLASAVLRGGQEAFVSAPAS